MAFNKPNTDSTHFVNKTTWTKIAWMNSYWEEMKNNYRKTKKILYTDSGKMKRIWYTSILLASPILLVYFFQPKRACAATLSVISYSFSCSPHPVVRFWFACLCLTDFQRYSNWKGGITSSSFIKSFLYQIQGLNITWFSGAVASISQLAESCASTFPARNS